MKRMARMSFCSIALLFISAIGILKAQTQTVTVRGTVIDKGDKQAVIGASVTEINKEKRTVGGVSTDINGNFALRITSTANQIQVSFLGYKTYYSGPINDRTVINISLEPSASEIQAVTVTGKRPVNTGTGLDIDERVSTAATVRVNAKDLEELAASSIDQALQGRMPGVDFGATSGDPGAGMNIRIRGTASLSGDANPLIVLDGMPYETSIPSDFSFQSADEQGYAQLLNIAPTDIKDITVLKDAASTALWGSKAANGVLLINTKRGSIGKPGITYNFRGTFTTQPNMIPMLTGDQYSMLIPEAIMNSTGLPLDFLGNSGQNKAFQYDPSDPYYYYNYSNNTDWIGLITRNGFKHDNNISISGGGERARYYASVGYLGDKGTTVGTDLKRITTKVNLDYSVSNKLRFRTDLTYTHIDNHLNFPTSGGKIVVRSIAYTKMPNMAAFEFDALGRNTGIYFSPESNIQGRYPSTYNPLALVNEGLNYAVGDRITPKFTLQYDILPGVLATTADVQFDVNNNKTKTFLPQIATGRPSNETVVNRASDGDSDNYNVFTKFNLTYIPKLGEKHQLQNLLSVQSSDTRRSGFSGITSNTASSLLQDISIPSLTNASGLELKAQESQSRMVAALIQSHYTFLDRYIVSVNARFEGVSKFGPDHRYGVFPGVSGRWRVSGEPFMRKFEKFLDELSIRGSYGTAGSAPGGDYDFYNTYRPFDWSYAGRASVIPSDMELSQLRWQTIIGKNLGFNLGLFKNRIRVDAEIYQNTTKDLFFKNLSIPSSTGFEKINMNIGTINNDGWELLINTTPWKSKKLRVDLDFNIARNVNSIQSISEFYPRESIAGVPSQGDYKSYLIMGNPFGSYYGFKFKGVYKNEDATIARDADGQPIIGPNGQKVFMRYNYPTVNYVFQPGDAIYEDINHDGNIDFMDMVYLGNGIPKFSGGFGPRVTIKGKLTLSAYFNYRWDYDIVNRTKMLTSNMYGVGNQSTAVQRRWRNPGDDTDIPRALYQDGYNWLGSDRYVEDASFIRLSQLTARYNLSKNITNKLGVKSGSMFVTGENLARWTKYTGQNPDVSIVGDVNPFKYPVDDALTPPSMTFLFGLSVGL